MTHILLVRGVCCVHTVQCTIANQRTKYKTLFLAIHVIKTWKLTFLSSLDAVELVKTFCCNNLKRFREFNLNAVLNADAHKNEMLPLLVFFNIQDLV